MTNGWRITDTHGSHRRRTPFVTGQSRDQCHMYQSSWIKIVPKICEDSAEFSYLTIDVRDWIDDGSLWLTIIHPSCAKKLTTYLQNCVVYILEWNIRILSFASVLVRWYLGEQGSSSVHPRTVWMSKFSPLLWQDLESSSLKLVGLAQSDQMDYVKQRINKWDLTHLHSCRKDCPREIDIRMDLVGKKEFILISTGENRGEQTLAISSPILTNGLNYISTASNDVTNFCWCDRVSEILVKASDALETRDWELLCRRLVGLLHCIACNCGDWILCYSNM